MNHQKIMHLDSDILNLKKQFNCILWYGPAMLHEIAMIAASTKEL